MPQYRDYEYTVIDNALPLSIQGCARILDDSPGYAGRQLTGAPADRIVISDDTRTRFRELVRSSSTTVVLDFAFARRNVGVEPPVVSAGAGELEVRTHPEAPTDYLEAIRWCWSLVDPQQQMIVQVMG